MCNLANINIETSMHVTSGFNNFTVRMAANKTAAYQYYRFSLQLIICNPMSCYPRVSLCIDRPHIFYPIACCC